MKIRPFRFLLGMGFAGVTGTIVAVSISMAYSSQYTFQPDKLFVLCLTLFPFSIAYALGLFWAPHETGEEKKKFRFDINPINGLYWARGDNLDSNLEVDRRMAARRARVKAAKKKQQAIAEVISEQSDS